MEFRASVEAAALYTVTFGGNSNSLFARFYNPGCLCYAATVVFLAFVISYKKGEIIT